LFELQMHHPAGGQRLVHQLRVVPERDHEGRVVSVLGIGRDVTGTVAQMEQIESLLHVDTLTQLANRRALKDRGAALLADAVSRGQRVGLLLLDVDHFKAVNDGLGHGAGDELLVAIAQRLRACARGEDLLCRLGGDEFVLAVHHAPDRDSLHALARRMHDAVGEPLRLGERELRPTMSIGLALFPDDAPSLEELLARADAAMYHAKRAGRGRTADYTSALDGGMHGRLVI
jgi:diguanylate cyclase (GGDEF)-like protein